MAHTLTWYSHDGKTANLIDYIIVNWKLAGSIQDTTVYRSAIIDVKSKDHFQEQFNTKMETLNLTMKKMDGIVSGK